jgi:hypothetical protein
MKKQLMILMGLLCLMGVVFAQGSENYALNWSVIAGGGCEMHSASYAMRSTIGQTAIGLSSDGYRIEAGYWYRDAGAAGDPIARYDANGNGYIDRDELKTAILDYLTPPIGTVISRDDLKTLILDYLAHL